MGYNLYFTLDAGMDPGTPHKERKLRFPPIPQPGAPGG
jgi:hypothetical protein